MTATLTHLKVVLQKSSDGAAPREHFEFVRALLESGYQVRTAADGAAADRNDAVVLRTGPKAPNGASDGHSIDGLSPAEVVALVQHAGEELAAPKPGGWKPWFPVIDYSRCTNCMQCLSFCLFDVYGVSHDGKIQVRNQSNCKTDCPACSRVCPEVAILFPKYKAGPINGDEIDEEDLRREAMKVDISALLGGDIYQMLRDRSARAKSRFSKERDDERALKERQRCFEKLKGQLDIPAELLAALPSREQIEAKAAAARAGAEPQRPNDTKAESV